jgi:hypothetical protein
MKITNVITNVYVYYRAGSHEEDDYSNNIITGLIKIAEEGYPDADIKMAMCEKIDNRDKQVILDNLIKKLKLDKEKDIPTILVIYDFNHLIGCKPFFNVVEELWQISKLTRIRTLYNPEDITEKAINLFHSLIVEMKREKGLIMESRMDHMVGRPIAEFDINRAARLKAEGFSYRQIAKQLCVSYMTIYRKMPKEVKNMFGSTMMKVRKRQSILGRELTELEKEKIQ